jgi:hypothetical protein
MLRFFGFLFLVGLGLGTWGWMTGRFTVRSSEHDGTWTLTTDVHKDRLAQDVAACERKLLEWFDAVDKKIDDLRHRARTANAKSRSALEQDLEEAERQKSEAQDLLHDLRNAPPDQLPEKLRRVDELTGEKQDEPVEKPDGHHR